jgi:hypothetical protein
MTIAGAIAAERIVPSWHAVRKVFVDTIHDYCRRYRR